MKNEDLIKFYTTHRAYIFPTVVALASIFLILFVIYPQINKLISNQKAISGLIVQLRNLETKATALESYDETDLSRKVEFALATLPTEKDFGNVLGVLQQLTNESGFSVNTISFENTAAKPGNSNSFQVKLEIQGSQVMLPTLLNSLENASRLVRVNSIEVSSNQTSQALDIALAIEILYSPLPKSFGSPDSPLPELSQKDEELLARLAKETSPTLSLSTIRSAPRGKSNPFE